MVGHAGGDHVVGADHVGLDCLHGIKLAGWHLLQSGRMEHIIHTAERIQNRVVIPHIAYVEFDFLRVLRIQLLIEMPHIVLLLLVPRENADLRNIRRQKPPQHRIPKRPGPTGYEEYFFIELRHILKSLLSARKWCDHLRRISIPDP